MPPACRDLRAPVAISSVAAPTQWAARVPPRRPVSPWRGLDTPPAPRYPAVMTRAYLALVALLAAACGSDSADPAPASTVCASGQQVACACADGSIGAQACKADGSGYEACQCGTGGASGSAGSSGTAGSGGTGGSGGTAGSDPLPVGVYQLSCLWRPYNSAGLDPGLPERFRLDLASSGTATIQTIPFDGTTVDGLASPTIPAAPFHLTTDGAISMGFPAFSIDKTMTSGSHFFFGVDVTMAGHASGGAACLEMSGTITTGDGTNPTFNVDVGPSGDICVLAPVGSDGIVKKPDPAAYVCTPLG